MFLTSSLLSCKNKDGFFTGENATIGVSPTFSRLEVAKTLLSTAMSRCRDRTRTDSSCVITSLSAAALVLPSFLSCCSIVKSFSGEIGSAVLFFPPFSFSSIFSTALTYFSNSSLRFFYLSFIFLILAFWDLSFPKCNENMKPS